MVCYERAHQALVALATRTAYYPSSTTRRSRSPHLNQLPGRARRIYESARALGRDAGSIKSSLRPTTTSPGSTTCAANTAAPSSSAHRGEPRPSRTGDGYHAALSLLDLSEIYLELNLSGDAREMAEQAHARFNDLGMGYEAAKALANAATSYGQEGKAFRALELYAEAPAPGWSVSSNHVWPSLIDLYQAILLVDEGRLFEARGPGAGGARTASDTSGLSARRRSAAAAGPYWTAP